MKIYKGYVQNFNQSLEVYSETNRKGPFSKFLEECTTNTPEVTLDLPSYLIMPGINQISSRWKFVTFCLFFFF